jgi:hypothetical protein
VFFKAETTIDTVVDGFQGATACITSLPRGTSGRCRDENTPILLRDVDADNAAIVARVHLPYSVALGLTLGTDSQANTTHRPFLGMDQSVSSIGVERARNRLVRLIIGRLFFWSPQFAGIDKWADVMLAP